jgi:hypothetical protein
MINRHFEQHHKIAPKKEKKEKKKKKATKSHVNGTWHVKRAHGQELKFKSCPWDITARELGWQMH